MDQAAALAAAKKYAALVTPLINPSKVVLFGSYATGKFHEYSDIDIAVVVDHFDKNFFDLAVQLNQLTGSVDTRIEPVLLSQSNDPSGFLSSILEKGILVYDNKNLA